MRQRSTEVIIVCGGRDFADKALLERVLDAYRHRHPELAMVIHGNARGADKLAGAWAQSRGIHAAAVDALWDVLGKRAAGPARNEAMLWLRPDAVIAFPGGTGTAHMAGVAEGDGIPVWRPLG